MKLLLLSPSLAADGSGQEAMRPYLNALTEAVARALQPTGNESLVGVWHANEVGMDAEAFDAEYAGKRIKSLADRNLLEAVLRRAADPWDGYFMWVRCQTTCRWVFFGYDAQAFLCLRTEDPAPAATRFIDAEDRTAMLVETDFFDG